MNKSKNKTRHRWIDRGRKEDGCDSYIYDCSKCGAERIKESFFSSTYIKNGQTTTFAPECGPAENKARAQSSGV